MKKILIASAAGAVTYFLIGWLVFGILLGSYTEANTTQIPGFKKSEEESSMLLIFVSCAAYALLIALILGQWARVETFRKGMVIGAAVGVLVAVMTDTFWYATSHFYNNPGPLVADVAAAGLTVGLMGGTVAAVLGRLGN